MTRIELSDNIALTCVKTDRFKTHILTAFLIRRLKEDEAAQNALIPSVLRRGNNKYPTLTAMSNRLADLYGAGLFADVRKYGEHHSFGFVCDFIGAENLGGVSELLFDTLTEPVFSDEFVLSERENLLNKIKALKNNKAAYASARHNALAYAGEPYGVPRLGDEETVAAITPEILRIYHQNALKSSSIEFFYCGSAEPDTVVDLIRPRLTSTSVVADNPSPLIPTFENPRHFFEFQDMSQAQISIIWRTGITAENPDYFPASVACAIYGGSTTSKLFAHVRERLSLCYTTHSLFERYKGLMKAQSGVEPSNLDRARDEMLTQWNDMVCGSFSDEEFHSAKSIIVSKLKSIGDSPAALENFWHGQAVCHLSSQPADWISAINNVTKDDVIRVASTFKLDSTYYLRAEQ